MWMQLYYDMCLVRERDEDRERPAWKKRGETASDARDRLREERERAKRELGIE